MNVFATAFMLALLCAAANAQPAPAPPTPEWGTILGRVVYNGKPPELKNLLVNKDIIHDRPPNVQDESLVVGPNGGLANVFVYLITKPSKIHPGFTQSKSQKVLLEVKDYRLVPHATALWTHDILFQRNREPYGVNIQYHSPRQKFGQLITAHPDREEKFQLGEHRPFPVNCNIHPWMQANLLVRDNPYFCVTDERGIFCIPNLPANEDMEFVFWHEQAGYLKNIQSDVAPITTNDKGRLQTKLTQPVTDLGEFRIEPAIFGVKE